MSLLQRLLAPPKTAAAGRNRQAATQVSTDRVTASPSPHGHEIQEVIAKAKKRDDVGRYAESLAIIAAALASSPDNPDLLRAKASTLFAWGRYHEAFETALRSDSLGPPRSNLCLLLGWSSFHLGKLEDADAWMRKARDVSPDAWETHFNLAVVLQAKKLSSEAVASYEKALALHPGDFDCLIGLGNCCLDLRDAVTAETYFRRAIAVQSKRPEAWNHLGVALGQQDRVDEAQEAFERCARLEAESGEDVESFVNLGIHLRDAGRTQEALDLFDKNLRRRPTVFGQLCYGHALLKAGRLVDGWNHYEFRWLSEPLLSLRVDFRRPIWTGQDLRDKTILVREEQGFGDTIQFIRYAPRVKALGATVLLRVGAVMESVARTFPGVDRVLGPADPTPEFDFLIHPLSLPRVFGTDLESIPAQVPYLQADPELVERWARRLNAVTGLRVGLVWAGSPAHQKDQYRSIPLSALAPLAELQGVHFVSLQKGAASDEIINAAPGFEIVNLGPELEDFCDTAAVISQLDLVICVDTAVAHLAGALGKPVWVMVPTPPDFRWMEGREDSPWYPTMRLFRQRRRGEWGDVVDRIKTELSQRVMQQPSTAAADATVSANTAPSPNLSPVQVADLTTLVSTGFSAVAETRMGLLQYLPDEAVVGPSITWYGEHLHSQLLLLTHIVRPGAIVMEVNAGIGSHSVVLANAVGLQGHLFLYESRKNMQPILRQNLAANRITNVTIMKRALARPTGSAPDVLDAAAVAGNTIHQNHFATETLDELQLDRLDWLKINDGSAALHILEGAMDTLWRLRPAMFITAGDETMLTALKNRVLEFSYRCWRMESALFNPDNFNRRDTDIFSGRTALTLLAIPEEIDVGIALDGCVELW
jgi:tetratricopeptide (TPR) repeat protein/precorrin-6B methylase 2